MQKLFLILFSVLLLAACKNQSNEAVAEDEIVQEETIAKVEYATFGDEITDENLSSLDEVITKYESMKMGDTIAVKFKAKVNKVCQNKGCWMKLDLGDNEAMVKFKDYGFFMPKDIAGEEVIVDGVVFVEEVSVDDQRHLAEDEGKTEEEIAAITEPKMELAMISHGVLIPKSE